MQRLHRPALIVDLVAGGWLSEAGGSVFLPISHLLLMNISWVGPVFVSEGESASSRRLREAFLRG